MTTLPHKGAASPQCCLVECCQHGSVASTSSTFQLIIGDIGIGNTSTLFLYLLHEDNHQASRGDVEDEVLLARIDLQRRRVCHIKRSVFVEARIVLHNREIADRINYQRYMGIWGDTPIR